jgi:osmotically inducible protein OsmC
MAPITRVATVEWTGDLTKGGGRLTTQSGALADSPITAPRRLNEPEGETSPEELLAGAHAGCFSMALAAACARAGYAGTRLTVTATVSLERVSGSWAITASQVEVSGNADGLTDEALQELIGEADRNCPLSSLIRQSAEVSIRATLG